MDEYEFAKSQKGEDKPSFREQIYQHQRFWDQNHCSMCEDKSCNDSVTLRGVPLFNAYGGSFKCQVHQLWGNLFVAFVKKNVNLREVKGHAN